MWRAWPFIRHGSENDVAGARRIWGIESEKAAERGQIVTISPAHSGAMVQESGEIWTA